MNTSSRVPGLTRNSGWGHVDAEIAAYRLDRQQETGPLGDASTPVGVEWGRSTTPGVTDVGGRRSGRL